MKLEKYYKGDKFKVKADGMMGNHVVHAGDVLCVQRTERITGDEDAVLFCELQDGSVIRESMSVLEDCTEPLFYIGEGTALARSLILLAHSDVETYESMTEFLSSAVVVGCFMACILQLTFAYLLLVPFMMFILALSCKDWDKQYDTVYQRLTESKTDTEFQVAKKNADKCLRRVRMASWGVNFAGSAVSVCALLIAIRLTLLL